MLASETDQGTENFSGLILYPSGPAGNTGGRPPSDFTFTYLYNESRREHMYGKSANSRILASFDNFCRMIRGLETTAILDDFHRTIFNLNDAD